MRLHLRRRHATNQMKLPTTEQAAVSNESWPFIRYFIYLFFPGNIFPWKVARPPKKAQNVSEISCKKAPLIQNSEKFVKTPKIREKNQVTFSIPLSSYFLEFWQFQVYINIYKITLKKNTDSLSWPRKKQQIRDLSYSRVLIACENIRFSSLFAAGDVSRKTSPSTKSEEKRMFPQASRSMGCSDEIKGACNLHKLPAGWKSCA